MEGVKILADNRKARYNYSVLENMEVGIELKGTEVKSLRAGKFSFADAFASVKDGELWLYNFHITPYDFGNIHNHEALRARKLLAHKQEIKRLSRKIDERGYTLIPLKVYLKEGRVKIDLGVCQGKKTYDKRNAIKARDLDREAQRELRGR